MFNFEGWKSKVMCCSIAPRHLIFKPFTEKFFWEMGRGAGRRTIGHGFQVICHHFIGFRLLLAWVNPLSPKSDQHEISPHNINALENIVVVRIEYMIREDESI